MKLLAYGPAWAVAALFTAGATPGMPDMPPEMLQGAPWAILGWIIFYMLVKVFPAHEKIQQEQREAFLKFLSDLERRKSDS